MTRPQVLLLALTAAAGTAAAAPVPKAADGPAEFVSKDWKFAAKFPSEPKKVEQEAAGVAFTMYSTADRNGAFMVGVADLPAGDNEPAEQTKARLDGAEAGASGNVGGKLKDSKDVTLGKQKYPGREFTATITKPAEGEVRARVYLVGKRMYQVMVVGTKEYANSPAATAFLDSFRLTD
jgi:hypothetical protein